jgi:glycosyltransferase involved in cell wall biosynthesis
MKIAQVVLSLDIGGQERLILRIVDALKRRGHDVHIVTFTRGGALRNEVGDTPVHEVPFRGAGMEAHGFDPTLHLRLWRLFRSLGPDVIHTHNGAPLVYAATSGRIARARIVHTKHGNAKYSARAMPLARTASRFVHHFVAVSKDTAEAARQNERPTAKALTVIENGIPLGAFGPDPSARNAIRDELGIPRDALVVGSVGRLVSEKDYPLLVRAMAPLLSERVRLVLVGEGPARADIEAAIEPKHRGLVVLTGARRDVPRLLASFDLFAMSSRTEGLPLALPEAMTSELPVVATAVGGVPSVVPEQAGELVPHGDASALRAAIERFLDDNDARIRTGKAARTYALGRFSEDRMLDQYLALYGR